MGSSIYQVGYQGAWAGNGRLGRAQTFMFELDTLSEALNEVRSRALGRLAQEASTSAPTRSWEWTCAPAQALGNRRSRSSMRSSAPP